jgi:hypothetical protein
MPRLIHLAPDRLAKKIALTGIKPSRVSPGAAYPELADITRAIWTFPVLPSFTMSYQWLRELKRCRKSPRTIVAVTFKIDDDEQVLVRYFNQTPVRMRAADAVGLILRHANPLGYEIIVTRAIKAREVVRVWIPPQKVGWRANTDRPLRTCPCFVCIPAGLRNSARRRARAAQLLSKGER